MDKLFGDLRNFFKVKERIVVDSFVFRLHYKVTMVLLIAFSVLVTGRQYIGDPIQCISKDDIPEDLLKIYCWIHTTFSVEKGWYKAVGKEVPYPGVDKYVPGDKIIYHAYYQWVCFVLFLQAVLFYIPRYLWKNVEAHRMRNLIQDLGSPLSGKRKLLVDYLVASQGQHNFYSYFYLFAGTLNFVNVVGQIYLMDVFLGGEFTTYGIDVVKFTEWDWTVRYDPMIRVFPRMTKCTFHRFGSSGDVQKHDAMCLLPINIVNEKIYVFLWFWFIILALLTGFEIIYRIITMYCERLRYWILAFRCPNAKPDNLKYVVKALNFTDWIILSFLCKNMDSLQFVHLIRELHEVRRIPRLKTQERCNGCFALVSTSENKEESFV